MDKYTIYFGKSEFYDVIRKIGGQWNDSKERPIVCLIKLSENDIRSCFYHLGRTDEKSIFFISDVVPITEKYIDRCYKSKYTGEPYIIKNNELLKELIRKTKRILSWENANPNFYRQHITDIKNFLLNENK